MAQYSAGASHEKLTALYVEEARRLGAAADRLANLADGDQEYPTN